MLYICNHGPHWPYVPLLVHPWHWHICRSSPSALAHLPNSSTFLVPPPCLNQFVPMAYPSQQVAALHGRMRRRKRRRREEVNRKKPNRWNGNFLAHPSCRRSRNQRFRQSPSLLLLQMLCKSKCISLILKIHFLPIFVALHFGGHEPKSCPVRIVSHRIFSTPPKEQQTWDSGNGGHLPVGPTKMAMNIWRHFSTDKVSIYNQQQRAESTVEMPAINNSAIIYSEHYEPDIENSLTSNFKCQFIFIGAMDERVQIIFHWFRLGLAPLAYNNNRRQHKNASTTALRCKENDHLTAHVLLDDRMSEIADFCGDELPAQLMSAKNVLTLTYVLKSAIHRHQQLSSSSSQNANGNGNEDGKGQQQGNSPGNGDNFGWIAEYRFIRDYGPQPAEALPHENRSCSFLFNGTLKSTGNVWSPNYPGFYPRNVDCQFVFIGSKDQIVLVTFEYFDVEGYGQCDDKTHSDFVLFSNYKTRDRTNRRFCGSLRPKGAIQSESNYFRMRFYSNDIFDGTGFYARYQFFNEKSSKSRVKLAPSSSNSIGSGGSHSQAFAKLSIGFFFLLSSAMTLYLLIN